MMLSDLLIIPIRYSFQGTVSKETRREAGLVSFNDRCSAGPARLPAGEKARQFDEFVSFFLKEMEGHAVQLNVIGSLTIGFVSFPGYIILGLGNCLGFGFHRCGHRGLL